MTNTFATMLHIITDGYDYQAMRNVAPVGAPLWCTCWVGLSSIVLLNMSRRALALTCAIQFGGTGDLFLQCWPHST